MVSLPFSQNFFEQNVSYSGTCCDFQRCLTYFLIKSNCNSLSDAITSVVAELFRTKCPRTAKIIELFITLLLFPNKAKNAGLSGKNAGMREVSQNAGFPARLRDG